MITFKGWRNWEIWAGNYVLRDLTPAVVLSWVGRV